MGFTDFAGSSVVHSVGGWASLVAAALVGPRIGKYNTDGTVNAIPGHNLMLGALGVFILWFGWFGFNPGSQLAISGDNAFKVAAILSQQILLELLEHWLQCS
jgi:Amt family ammonium transporter